MNVISYKNEREREKEEKCQNIGGMLIKSHLSIRVQKTRKSVPSLRYRKYHERAAGQNAFRASMVAQCPYD